MRRSSKLKNTLVVKHAVDGQAYWFESCQTSNHIICTCLRCGSHYIAIDSSFLRLKRLRKSVLSGLKAFNKKHMCYDEVLE